MQGSVQSGFELHTGVGGCAEQVSVAGRETKSTEVTFSKDSTVNITFQFGVDLQMLAKHSQHIQLGSGGSKGTCLYSVVESKPLVMLHELIKNNS